MLKYYWNWLIAPVVLMAVGTTPLVQAQEAPRTQTSTPTPFGDRIVVKEFVFQGNTAFSDAELAELTQDYTGRPLTFAELLEVESAVSKLYNDAGYINSGATIPANQSFSPMKSIVIIQIVEGGVADIDVRVRGQLHPGYVRSRLGLAAKQPLNQNQLLEAMQLLQLNPLIENISAQLSAGPRPELSFLEVDVTEADNFNLAVVTDNGRTPSVGSWRRGLEIRESNLLGFGDSVDLSYSNTDGSNTFDARYTIPLNARNGTLSLSARITDTEVVEPPFDRIDITGDSEYYDVSLRQPVIQTPTRELALGAILTRQSSQTQLLGTDFQLSPGANEDGETRVSAIRFFQDWTQRTAADVFSARSQFNVGVGWFDATVNSEPPDSRFFFWRGQAQYVRLLAPDTLFIVRSDTQLATEALVPLEQIGIGGLRSVRGYRQDLLLTDNGLVLSAEVQFPILRVKKLDGILHLVPFVDFGWGWNSSGRPNADPNSLLGVGLGLKWQMGDRLDARLDWGIPLTDVDSSDKTWQENGVYFTINYNLLRF
ncbi:MAG: ShlB/FhaC/HecB family hemolysin secretion/activation protein [Hormoscilla sp.]